MNIVLDFSGKKTLEGLVIEQELAVMSANLATKLLKQYAVRLKSATLSEVIQSHVDDLRTAANIETVVNLSIEFVETRSLIENVIKANWGMYAVKEVVKEPLTKRSSTSVEV